MSNLILLCYRHHRLVHEGGYSIETGSTNTQGARFFRRPDGRVVPQNGYLVDDWMDESVDADQGGGVNSEQVRWAKLT